MRTQAKNVNKKSSPYTTHLFICESCTYQTPEGETSPALAAQFRRKVKELCAKESSKDQLRVNGSQCLGACQSGLNAVLYPEGIWWRELRAGDEEKLAQDILEHHKEAQKT